MYTSRYIIYLSWIILIISLLYNFKSMGKPTKQEPIKIEPNKEKEYLIINIIWGDSSKELYSIFKLAGITPDESQKKIMEKEIKNQYNPNGIVGFKHN